MTHKGHDNRAGTQAAQKAEQKRISIRKQKAKAKCYAFYQRVQLVYKASGDICKRPIHTYSYPMKRNKCYAAITAMRTPTHAQQANKVYVAPTAQQQARFAPAQQ